MEELEDFIDQKSDERSLGSKNSFELTILDVVQEKIVKTILNPKVDMKHLESLDIKKFFEEADIHISNKKHYRRFIIELLRIREATDSILYGKIDFETMTFRDILSNLSSRFDNATLKLIHKYLKAYIVLILLRIKGLEKETGGKGISPKTPQEILASVEYQPNFLTIVKNDDSHFNVVGKNLPQYRSKLLSMGGLVHRKKIGGKWKSRKDVITFDNHRKKEIKKFIFDAYTPLMKAERSGFAYAKRKFKIYLDAAVLYIDYNNLEPHINYKLIIKAIRDMYNCAIHTKELKEESGTSEFIRKILTKITTVYPRHHKNYTIDENAILLLTSIVFYQTDMIFKKDIADPENYGVMEQRMQYNKRKVLQISCGNYEGLKQWHSCCAKALIRSARSIKHDALGSRLLDYSLAFVSGMKGRTNVLLYTKNMRDAYINAENKMKDLEPSVFFAHQGILWYKFSDVKESSFPDRESLITFISAINILTAKLKTNDRLKIRVKCLL